jgi:hypothetical protein
MVFREYSGAMVGSALVVICDVTDDSSELFHLKRSWSWLEKQKGL